jgi:hypothetical protein
VVKQRLSNLIVVITLNKTLMKQIQNNQKSVGKSIPDYGFLKSQEKKIPELKVSSFLPNLCDVQ